MRFAVLLFAVAALALPAHATAPDKDTGLKHAWLQQQGKGVITYISKYPAPAPFSETGEPEATLAMSASKIEKDMTLGNIVESEIAGIRETLKIADYEDKDGHKPDNGIVSYLEEINGCQVAFIKYRVAGAGDKTLPRPRSVTHAILVKNGKAYFVHLIVIYAGHSEEVAADQIRLVKAIIRH